MKFENGKFLTISWQEEAEKSWCPVCRRWIKALSTGSCSICFNHTLKEVSIK